MEPPLCRLVVLLTTRMEGLSSGNRYRRRSAYRRQGNHIRRLPARTSLSHLLPLSPVRRRRLRLGQAGGQHLRRLLGRRRGLRLRAGLLLCCLCAGLWAAHLLCACSEPRFNAACHIPDCSAKGYKLVEAMIDLLKTPRSGQAANTYERNLTRFDQHFSDHFLDPDMNHLQGHRV